MRVLNSEFSASGLRSSISGFRFLVLDFGFRVTSFGLRKQLKVARRMFQRPHQNLRFPYNFGENYYKSQTRDAMLRVAKKGADYNTS